MSTQSAAAQRMYQKIRPRMLISHPFFASLLMGMPMVETKDIPTLATDMKRIFFNPDFIDGLTDDQALTGLAHEVLHPAFENGFRLNGRNRLLWNMACDYVNNLVLVDAGFAPIQGWLCDDKYKGWSADQVYEDLQKQAAKCRKKGGSGKPGDDPGMPGGGPMEGDLLEPDVLSPAEQAKVERAIRQQVAQAANIARLAGKLPGELERLVGELLDPKVAWQVLLRDYMLRVTKSDETWSRRNRRFANTYLPTRYSEKMGPIVMIMDTSGSIGNDELTQYASETAAIAEDVKPESIRIVWADTKVAGEQLFEEGEPIIPVPKGGGGTDMTVPLKHVEQYDPEVVILFTDCYTPWPESEPPYPLIVCATTNADCPIGQVVRI